MNMYMRYLMDYLKRLSHEGERRHLVAYTIVKVTNFDIFF